MVVCLSGELDFTAKDRLEADFEAAAAQPGDVELELSGVTYADSTALGLLVKLHNRLRHQGRTIRLLSPSPQMRKLLNYAGLDRAFEIVDVVG